MEFNVFPQFPSFHKEHFYIGSACIATTDASSCDQDQKGVTLSEGFVVIAKGKLGRGIHILLMQLPIHNNTDW